MIDGRWPGPCGLWALGPSIVSYSSTNTDGWTSNIQTHSIRWPKQCPSCGEGTETNSCLVRALWACRDASLGRPLHARVFSSYVRIFFMGCWRRYCTKRATTMTIFYFGNHDLFLSVSLARLSRRRFSLDLSITMPQIAVSRLLSAAEAVAQVWRIARGTAQLGCRCWGMKGHWGPGRPQMRNERCSQPCLFFVVASNRTESSA